MPTINLDFGAECTPQERVAALRKAFDTAKPGDTVFCPGVYEAPRFPAIPPGVTVLGERGKTIWRTPWALLLNEATAIELGDGCTVKNLRIESTAEKNKQTCGIGFGTPSDKKRTATLEGLYVYGFVWGFYSWHGPNNQYWITDCDFEVARVGITGGRSDGPDAQTIIIKDSRINLNDALSTQGGSVTHPQWGGQAGVLMRGGYAKLDGLTVKANGPSPGTGPRVVAATDWLDLSSATQTVIEVVRLRTALNKNGASELWDIDMRYGKLRTSAGPWELDWAKRELYSGGSFGSGKKPDGSNSGKLTCCPLAPLPPAVKLQAEGEEPSPLDPDVDFPWLLQERGE